MLYILFNSTNSYSQIQWDSTASINWDNFKGSPIERKLEFKAGTTSYLECEYGSHDTCLFYNVRTFFDEVKSWHIDTTNELLEHEGGHFNISEIYARKIRQFLRINLRKEISDEKIRSGINALEEQKERYQELYDRETNYSINFVTQKCWQLKIHKQLEELQEYRMTEYTNCLNF